VRQRGQVAAAAERAELGHGGQPAPVQQAQERGRQLRPGPRDAGGQRAGPQQHHRPGHLGLDRLAHAGGVGGDERPLEPGPLVGRDLPGGEAAEPRGDPVRRLGRGGQRLDVGPGGGHGRHGLVGQADPGPLTGDGHHVVTGQALRAQHDRHGRDGSHLRRPQDA
jgi:hypothetical protein